MVRRSAGPPTTRRAAKIRAERAIGMLIAAGIALLAVSELSHWRASSHRLGDAASPGDRQAIVVLGFRNRGTRANAINRHRVRAAIRSVDPAAGSSVLIFCGGAVGGVISEADLMDRFVRSALRYTGASELDRDSTSTWENITNLIPHLECVDSIKIVSDSLHAAKGRTYLWAQRPDLAWRLTRGADYRLGDLPLIKVLSFARTVGAAARARLVV